MARKDDDDLDLAVEPAKKAGSSRLKKILMIGGAALLLVALSVGTALFLAKQFFATPGSGDAGKEQAAEEHAAPKQVLYVNLDPPFVVNFEDQGVLRFLQVGVQLLVSDQPTADQLQHHMPVVRNNLLLIFSSLDHEGVTGREAKEKLRQAVLSEIQTILKDRGVKGSVDGVYFTSFVMQ